MKVDGGVCYKGYHSDATRMHCIGNVSNNALQLKKATEEAFFEALKYCEVGNHICDISKCINDYIDGFGYYVVVDYTGHGIGQSVHEDPDVPNYEMTNKGPRLRPNMVLAIEPMVNEGCEEVIVDEKDGWTVRTLDGSLSAHYENTVLITEHGPEILSL